MPNEYDNEVFFQQYAQMERSKGGLECAGEWHQLKPLFPCLQGLSVLDLGCGYGWHCKYAADNGAAQVLGIDLSKKMLGVAREKNADEKIRYRHCGIEEYEYPAETWDLVVSNLVLHYIADLETVFCNVYKTLKPGGVFLFNVEHPVFTAGVGQDWVYDEDGTPKHWPMDDYYHTGTRITSFLGCEVVKEHHTLTQIFMGLLNCGFLLEAVEEAMPPEQWRDQMPEEMKRPMMLLVKARKQEG